MRISIFGYGVTTTPLVSFLNQQGHNLYIYDDKFTQSHNDDFGNTLLPPKDFIPEQSDREILSPGIPPSHSLVRKAQHLISEYDYFYELLHNDMNTHKKDMPFIIWISGTNGKTTTTEMTTLLLEPFNAQSGGNIGTPLATLYTNNPKVWVLETSSFTLHYTHNASPRIYALLPVKEDHISWHGSFENYIEDKLSPLKRMDSHTYAIIPSEFAHHSLAKDFKGTLILYESSQDLAQKCSISHQDIIFKEPFLLDAIIALSIAKFAFKADDMRLLNTFHIGAHRIAEFYDRFNRLWVDDSKGTNVDATIQAIARYTHTHIIVILGGDDKGANLTPLFEFIKDKDIEIISIGANEERLCAFAKKYNIAITPCQDIYKAMDCIHKKRDTNAKDVVLLSPAAASLDQFSSYKQRGEIFTQLALHS
ncbi:UDP-N-acetylmuramoyl-L-alanine--D-glutamate ligase [Helicobacter sp. MIT 21-1697]|uniref:UDP-N-acetylmuramoyl-L-alanine--D-glutamate ligase n=1 Tax=Helicobacter sp. MIT 21-1697 TaxID=2993733 RepID=UPI00224A5CAE|nr:UDP-N-acetylmuramoyl-L-alanine--D-glutamate ligase [Helicobacter sp. MIT 21-1697]MCX2717061.1 UDP-N-acetylmuramoyl-L-alanine--D-glutamate ligase [Helicobacter sp. MIT 21-1697]